MGNADVLMKDIAEVIESSHPSCGQKKECETKCGECGAARIKTAVNKWLEEQKAIVCVRYDDPTFSYSPRYPVKPLRLED